MKGIEDDYLVTTPNPKIIAYSNHGDDGLVSKLKCMGCFGHVQFVVIGDAAVSYIEAVSNNCRQCMVKSQV